MLAIQMRSAEHALQHAGRLPMLKRWPLQGDAELNRGTLDVRVSREAGSLLAMSHKSYYLKSCVFRKS